jgi:hypothetical protein
VKNRKIIIDQNLDKMQERFRTTLKLNLIKMNFKKLIKLRRMKATTKNMIQKLMENRRTKYWDHSADEKKN